MCRRVPPPATSLVAMANASAAPQITAAGADLDSAGRVFQRLLKERIVFIGSAIDQITANLVCAQLILLEAEDPEQDISLYINSPGGSVTDGLAIYDTMQYVRPDVSHHLRRPGRVAWASSCCAPAPRASASPCRTRGS